MRLLAPQTEGPAARRASRDPQQERVYEAEQAAGSHHSWPFSSIETLGDWFAGLMSSGLIEEWYPSFMSYDPENGNALGSIKLRERRVGKHKNKPGRTIAHASRHELAFTKEGMRTWIALHELAHMIVARRDGKVGHGHGWQFCEVYLRLVGTFIGRNEAQMMKDEFDKRGIFYSKEQAVPAWLSQRMGGRG